VTALARSLALGVMERDRPPAGVVGVGVDAVDLARFGRVLGRRSSVAGRLFTAREVAYARTAPDPVPRLSTRFAAKEAVMKALGVGLWAYPFHDVEVVRVGLDAPGLVLTGAAAGLARRAGVVRWHLALSHTDEVAVALVVAEGTPPGDRLTPGGGAGGDASSDRPPTS
jgi:holo-[acyl-carrier protein] synthase